jgi:hypothetical protein
VEVAAALLVAARADDERKRLDAQRQADAIDLVEQARLRAERDRAEIQKATGPSVLLALALQELAGQLGNIDHLTITPDLIGPLLHRVAAGDGAGAGAGADNGPRARDN